jgi:TRAP-type C4-dicarboxylate transport system permease large subunit
MDKSVRNRVLDSFQDDKGADEAREYSDKVYAAWKDISTSLSRSALLIFLLIAVFELLVYQTTTTVISIGTLTFANSSTVQIVLPAVVAFFIYDGYRLSARWLRLERAYATLTEIYSRKQRANALDLLIEPNLPSL